MLIAGSITGCAGSGAPGAEATPDYAELVADLRAERSDAWDRLDAAFLRLPDFQSRLERLGVLHRRAATAEPDADQLTTDAERMLELYFGDLRAHALRHRLALAAGDDDVADFHLAAAEAIAEALKGTGDGSAGKPFAVVAAPQAHAWLDRRDIEIVGALYATEDDPENLTLVLKTRSDEQLALQDLHFDLTPTFRAGVALTSALGVERPTPSQIVATRASQGDSAAQTAHAIELWQSGPEFAGRAVQWLQAAGESGNIVAREMLGVIYGSLATGRSGEEAERLLDAAVDQFLLAVNQGSDTAMYNLAQLYLSGHFGEENQPSGVALLEQAAERDNLDALVMLARLNYNGQFVPEDRDRAVELLARASARGHTEAQLFHARHMLSTDDGIGFDKRARGWLEEAATIGRSADAMLLLGTLHARGEHVEQDDALAVRWLLRAAAATDDPETINSVAWILAVAESPDLRDAPAALELMDALMDRDEQAAANPAYIDTWAAANAANARFEDAVRIQRQALAIAEQEAEARGTPPDYLPVLREHLELFEAGGTISEDVP